MVEAQSLPSYSDTFNLILRLDSLPTSPPTLPVIGSPLRPATPPSHLSSPRIPPAPLPPPQPYLSGLKPVLPPPPFTPSHPAFLHFSELASERSRKLREAAEQDLAQLVASKRAHVEQVEDTLRREVEFIWRSFREGTNKFERDRSQSSRQRTSLSKDRDNPPPMTTEPPSPGPRKAAVAIRDFAPVVTQSVKTRATMLPTPRVSILSASIATTTFHHPMAMQDPAQFPPDVNLGRDPQDPFSSDPSSSGSSESRTLSTQSTSSSKAISLRPETEGTRIPQPFKRSIDPARDRATSLKYHTILEADLARAREREDAATTQRNAHNNTTRGRSEVVKTIANGGEKPHASQMYDAVAAAALPRPPLADSGEASRVEPKGKRKVTFDVKAGTVGNRKEVASEENGDNDVAQSNQVAGTASLYHPDRDARTDALEKELIFEIDDDGSDRSTAEPSTQVVLPLLTESPPLRPRRIKKPSNNKGLPESLVSLRPASLPLPSHIRPPRGHHGADASGQTGQLPPRQARADTLQRKSEPAKFDDDEPLSITEAELLKLVAAGTPSHRGAWNRDGKAWQLFTRRHDDRTPFTGTIPEESEEGEDVSEGGPSQGSGDAISEFVDANGTCAFDC